MVFNNGIIQPNCPKATVASNDANQAIAQVASQAPKEYSNAFKNPLLTIAFGADENSLFIILYKQFI